MQTRHLTLTPHPPFNFPLILETLLASPGSVLEVLTASEYRRALQIDGTPVLVTVRAADGQAQPTLSLAVTAERVDEATAALVADAFARIFVAGLDTSPIDALDDPVFAQAWALRRGFRPVQLPDVFEAIAWAIIGQQINVAFAARCKRALTERYGGRMEVDGATYLLFPTPETLAPLDEANLQALQFSRQKARYVIGLSRAIIEGRFKPGALAGMPADEALARLQELLGVGRWTAEYVLLRGLGYPDALPAGDVALQKAVGRAYGLGRNATEAEVRTLGERWAPWRSYATITWWQTNRVGA